LDVPPEDLFEDLSNFSLSNIRITTFFAGESEAKIVVPSRISEVQAVTSGIVHPIRDRPITDLPESAKTHPSTRSTRRRRDGLPEGTKTAAHRRFGPRPHRAAWAGNHAITVRRWELCRSQFRILGCKNLAPSN
jgi:hypothetical protein